MPTGRRRRDRPRIRFRLTTAGWVFLASSLLVALVALNSGLALLFVLFGCMLGALHVSAVLSRRMVAAVQVQRELPDRCRQNQRVGLGYFLRSIRGGGACLALRVEEMGLKDPKVPPAHCGCLPARQGHLSRTEMTPLRRGRVHFRGLRLCTTFPFGLIAASRQFRRDASLVVWPGRGRLTAPLLGRGEAHSAGVVPSIHAGGQDEFYGLREYRLGDNARWIHWRRSAGRPEPVIREMARPRPQTLWVVLDTLLADRSRPAAARRERAIRFAATIIEDALAAGYRVGAVLAYEEKAIVVGPTDRRTQRQHLLDALADIDENRTRPLADSLARLRPGWLHMAHVVVIASGRDGEGLGPEALARLRRDCHSLTIVTDDRIAELYCDDPVASMQEAG